MNANSNNTAILSCSPSVKQEEKRFNWMLSRKNVTPWISCKLHLQSVIIIQAVDFLQHSDLRPRYFTETLNVPHYLHSYVLISVEQTHNMQRCIWGLKLIWTSECWKQKKHNLEALEIPINSLILRIFQHACLLLSVYTLHYFSKCSFSQCRDNFIWKGQTDIYLDHQCSPEQSTLKTH